MTTLLLVRHAQSLNNAQPENLRVNDPGLTPTGIAQSERVAEWLVQFPITDLYCSPFLRSLQTTSYLTNRSKMVAHVRMDLFEQGGCYDGYPPLPLTGASGLSPADISQLYPEWIIDERMNARGWWHGKHYETEHEARVRAVEVVRWILDQHPGSGRLVAMVIHADFLRILVGELLSATDMVNRWRDSYNTGVTQLSYTASGWRLDFWNSIGHLPPTLRT